MDSRILHYEFVTGESVNITVSAEIAEVIYDSRRMEHASNERSRYHTAFSLDSEDYEGTNLVSEKTPDDLMEELEDREHLLDCLAHLSENQRQRILMLAQGMSIPLFSVSPTSRTRKHLNVSGIFCLPQATQRKRVDIVDENLSTRYTEDGCGVLVRQRTTTTRSLTTE